MKQTTKYALLGAGSMLVLTLLLSAAVTTAGIGAFQVSAGPGYFVVIDTRTGEVKSKESTMSQVFSQTSVTGSLSVGTDVKGSLYVSNSGALSIGQEVEGSLKSPNFGQLKPWSITTAPTNPYH